MSKYTDKLVMVLVLVVVAMAFGMGAMWSKLQTLGQTTQPKVAGEATQAAQAPAAPKVDINTIKGLWDKNVVKFGDVNKKNLLVEIMDPSCPYCHAAAGLNSELNNQMGAQFKLVADGGTYVAPVPEMRKLADSGAAGVVVIYTPGHGNGEMGMKALYCANEKGKYWDVHGKLMSSAGYTLQNTTVKNDKTKSGDVAQFLADVIDQNFMKSCLDSGKYDSRLGEDTKLASALGVSGTPGFFINETNFAGAYSWNDMKSALK